jgi:hypothetical protein
LSSSFGVIVCSAIILQYGIGIIKRKNPGRKSFFGTGVAQCKPCAKPRCLPKWQGQRRACQNGSLPIERAVKWAVASFLGKDEYFRVGINSVHYPHIALCPVFQVVGADLAAGKMYSIERITIGTDEPNRVNHTDEILVKNAIVSTIVESDEIARIVNVSKHRHGSFWGFRSCECMIHFGIGIVKRKKSGQDVS